MYFISTFFPKGHYAFILWSAILFAIYIFFLFVLKEFGSLELEIVRQLVKRKKALREELEEEVI